MIAVNTTAVMGGGCLRFMAGYPAAMLFDRSGATYVGNLGPVPLFIHPSALFLLVLVYLLFQPRDPMTFVILLSFLVVAIVLHEMGHGLMARALGAQGVTITLMAMGGLCSSYRERDRHFGEMLILAAGPAVSFALWGGSLLALAGLESMAPDAVGTWRDPTLLREFLFNNARINFWLGVFNSLPIYPLDGGQFLFHLLRLCRVRWQATHQISFYISVLFVAAVLAWLLSMNGGRIDTGFVWVAFLLGYMLYNAYVYLMQR